MLKLIQNEWIKLWRKKGTWIMVIILALAIVGLSSINKIADQFDDSDWIEEMQADVVKVEEQLASPDLTEEEIADLELERDDLQESIAMNIEYNQPTTREGTIVNTYDMMSIVTLLTVIAAAGIVATEFSQGTIKMLLSRPVKRWKILISKYLTVLLFGLLLAVITYVLSIASAFILFPSAEGNSILWGETDLAVTAVWGKSLYMMLLGFANVIMISTFAFMLGSVFRSTSLAIGVSLFLHFTGTLIVVLLEKFAVAKYILFAHGLTQYETGYKLLESNTMSFSIVVLVVYAVVFLAISFTTFIKRDITA